VALPGETSGFLGARCSCGRELALQVCQSAAGWYLGYFCPDCGPWSRETGYYATREEAARELALAHAGVEPEGVR
jgi:hypothetical protein